jgi:hypothetical protein
MLIGEPLAVAPAVSAVVAVEPLLLDDDAFVELEPHAASNIKLSAAPPPSKTV